MGGTRGRIHHRHRPHDDDPVPTAGGDQAVEEEVATAAEGGSFLTRKFERQLQCLCLRRCRRAVFVFREHCAKGRTIADSTNDSSAEHQKDETKERTERRYSHSEHAVSEDESKG